MDTAIDYTKETFTEGEKAIIRGHIDIVREKYPDHVPILVRINSNVLRLHKRKFLVSGDVTCSKFLFILQKKLVNVQPNDTLQVLVNGKPIDTYDISMFELYERERDTSINMLVVTVSRQTTFKWIRGLVSYYAFGGSPL